MKKLLILFLFAGLVFSTTSCKKKECPKPEVWAPGTWKVTKVVSNGTEQDASDPTVACWLTDQLVLNEDGGGSIAIHDYDDNTSACEDLGWTLISWAENLKKKILILDFNYVLGESYVKLDYVDKTHLRWNLGSSTYEEFTKQD